MNPSSTPENSVPIEYFEGSVEYKIIIKFTPPTNQKARRLIESRRGDKMVRYYRSNGDFVDYNNGSRLDRQWIITKSNREYFLWKNDTVIRYGENSEKIYQPLSIKTFRGDIKILGHETVKVVVEYENSQNTFWFAVDLHVDVDRYANYSSFGYNQIIAKGRGVLLQYEEKGEKFSITKTAIKINQDPIPQHVFELPDLPLKPF